MSLVATVETTYLYSAVCGECAWWGEQTDDEDEAERDAERHNRQEHTPEPTDSPNGAAS